MFPSVFALVNIESVGETKLTVPLGPVIECLGVLNAVCYVVHIQSKVGLCSFCQSVDENERS